VRPRVAYGVSHGPPTHTLTANHRHRVAPCPLRPAFLPASTSSLPVQAYVALLPPLLIFMQTQELLLEKFQEPSVVSTTTTTKASDPQSDLRCVVCDVEFDTQLCSHDDTMPCASTADQTYMSICAQLTACVKLPRLIHRWTKPRWMNFCEHVAPAQFPCCVECEGADAILNCVNCNATLCQECFDDSHRSKILRTHITSTIEATVGTSTATLGLLVAPEPTNQVRLQSRP
jgi:hypothetical protein